MSDHPIIESLKIAQRDLTTVKARLSEIQRQVATLSFVPSQTYPCPECNIPFPSALKRDEHVYRIHGGPLPEHYRDDPEPETAVMS